MKRFRFRFETVLRYREIIEEKKKRDFGIALNHLQHEKMRFEEIEDSISRHIDIRERSGTGRISARNLQNQYNYALLLDSNRNSQGKQISKAESEMKKKLSALVDATKDKKIFERLKERDQEQHEGAERGEEQAFNDELSVLRHKQRKR